MFRFYVGTAMLSNAILTSPPFFAHPSCAGHNPDGYCTAGHSGCRQRGGASGAGNRPQSQVNANVSKARHECIDGRPCGHVCHVIGCQGH